MAGKESNQQQIITSDDNNSEDNVNSSFELIFQHITPLNYEIFTHICVCVCVFLKLF